jgi:hypothetical protein
MKIVFVRPHIFDIRMKTESITEPMLFFDPVLCNS